MFKDGWKPLNYGFVLATLTFCDVAEFLFKNGFDFILGHQFTQDVTENIFSQIRRKAGSIPTALKALRGIRLISVLLFVSEVKRNNYMHDSDEFLLGFCKEKKKYILETASFYINQNVLTSEIGEFRVQAIFLEDFNRIIVP